jgi:tRNA A-37 threonylcarbamoyl transferase component Bud32
MGNEPRATTGSMTITDIKTVVREVSGVDPDATFEMFREETGSGDPDKFLTYLREKDLVSSETFCTLHAREPIDLTEVVSVRTTGPMGQATLVLDEASDASSAPGVDSTHSLRYEPLGTVGKGGMGLVYVARDVDLRRKVALKRLTPEFVTKKAAVGRFVREVQITAQLDHPHIVPVYGLEVSAPGTIGYAMKLVQGMTFGDLIEETRELVKNGAPFDDGHTLATRLDHFLKVCDGVSYAHSKNVLHRDLKPANLMLGRYNEVYVMDWGLARLMGGAQMEDNEPTADPSVSASAEETKAGTVMGTPRYMSPEQLGGRNQDLDGRSDEFALGLILHELVTLEPAVPGTTLEAIVHNTLTGILEPAGRSFGGDRVPPELVAIIGKATALKPAARYPSVSELGADLRRYLHGEAIVARPDSALQKIMRAMVRHRRAALMSVLGIVAASALGVAFSLVQEQKALRAAREREKRIEGLLSVVADKAEKIESHFDMLEGLLEGFAAAAEQALTHGAPSAEPYYLLGDFKSPSRHPPDLAPSVRYNGRVSADYPVWAAAAGVPLDRVRPEIRRLNGLGIRKRMFLEIPGAEARETAPSHALLEKQTMSLLWTFIGLSDGLVSFYPGTDSIPDGYDPRLRPWYALALEKRSPQWGSPHVDAMGTGLTLPCSVALRDESGRLLGVAGVELTFDYVIAAFLSMPEVPSARETFLLDAEGRILVDSTEAHRTPQKGVLDGALKLSPFPDPAVVEAIRAKQSGFQESTQQGKAVLIAYRHLDTLDLSYAVLTDGEQLLGAR